MCLHFSFCYFFNKSVWYINQLITMVPFLLKTFIKIYLLFYQEPVTQIKPGLFRYHSYLNKLFYKGPNINFQDFHNFIYYLLYTSYVKVHVLIVCTLNYINGLDLFNLEIYWLSKPYTLHRVIHKISKTLESLN